MELRHLRYFRTVADLGSISAAARQLRVAQSSISEQLADLEHELGGALLDRSGRRVKLTPLGVMFLGEARGTLDAAERAVEEARRFLRGQSGTLTIGFFLWGAGGFFPRLVRDYRRRYPEIRLNLLDMHANDQVRAVEEGRLDVGLTRPPEASAEPLLRSELLLQDPVVAAVRPDHPLAGKVIRMVSLAREPLVLAERRSNPRLYDSVMALFAGEGLVPAIANTSPTWSGVLTLAEAGEGVALVPAGVRHLRTRGLVFCRLEPEVLSLGLSAVWNPRRVTPALEGFLRLLGENRDRIQRSVGVEAKAITGKSTPGEKPRAGRAEGSET